MPQRQLPGASAHRSQHISASSDAPRTPEPSSTTSVASKAAGELTRDVPPAAALARLRELVKSLEGGAKIIRQGQNVTQAELRILNLEIAYLEKLLASDASRDP
jgi:hypothetical protein